MLMQMRNNCNHPDIITSKFDNSPTFPPAEVLLEQSGKLQLLDRLLTALKAKGHKVLIFSQVGHHSSQLHRCFPVQILSTRMLNVGHVLKCMQLIRGLCFSDDPDARHPGHLSGAAGPQHGAH